MQTKLTLRMEEAQVARAKKAASLRGTSVSKMFSEYVDLLDLQQNTTSRQISPITASLVGILREKPVEEADYKTHLRKKHL